MDIDRRLGIKSSIRGWTTQTRMQDALLQVTEVYSEAYYTLDHNGVAAQQRGRAVRRMYVGGLHTAYCIRESVRHRLREVFFFFQAEDGIRDYKVTGVQTCALPI